MAIGIVSFPMKNRGSFHSCVNVYQRVPFGNQTWPAGNKSPKTLVEPRETHRSKPLGGYLCPHHITSCCMYPGIVCLCLDIYSKCIAYNLHIYIYIDIHTYIHIYIYMYLFIYLFNNIYIYTHMYTHTHKYIYIYATSFWF